MGLDNPTHIAILVVLLLLVFGARRLPEIGRSLGSGIREFKSAVTGESENAQTPPPSAAPMPGPARIATTGPPASDVGGDAATAIAPEQPEHAGTPAA